MLSQGIASESEAGTAIAKIELGAAHTAAIQADQNASLQEVGSADNMNVTSNELFTPADSTKEVTISSIDPECAATHAARKLKSDNQPTLPEDEKDGVDPYGSGEIRVTSQDPPLKSRHLRELIAIMLDNSIGAYILAYARSKAREGLKLFDELLQLPLTKETLFRIFFQEEETVKTMLATNPLTAADYRMGLYQLDSVFQIHADYQRRRNETGSDEEYQWIPFTTESSSQFVIVEAGDEREKDELVYFIALDHMHGEICVFFRGSANINDWGANLNPGMSVVEQPVKELQESLPTIQVQEGFRNYLFEKPNITLKEKPKGEPNPNELKSARNLESMVIPPSKCDFIINEVEDLLIDYPDYTISVTGHSLGGGIAHLFASWAACQDNIPRPITCVTFAAPKAGNVDFRRTIDWLERNGRLRLLRIVNVVDPIPRAPFRAYRNDCCCLCQTKNIYIQIGPRIELTKSKPIKLTFGRPFYSRRSYMKFFAASYMGYLKYFAWFFTAGGWGYYALDAHACLTYYKLLQEQKAVLEQLSLDDIYEAVFSSDECSDRKLSKKFSSLLTIEKKDKEN